MDWLRIVYFFVVTLALIASFRSFTHRKYILFVPLLILGLMVELVAELPFVHAEVRNDIGAFYTMAEYAFLSYIISNFIHSRSKQLLIRYSILVLVPVFILIELTVANRSPNLKYLTVLIENPLVCLWTIIYLFEAATEDYEFEVAQNPMFWISLGNLLFFSGSFFSYGLGSYLLAGGSRVTADKLFNIARILNILLYILYFIGFVCLRKKR